MISWFANNQMTANDYKYHLILSSPEEDAVIQIEESRVKCSKVKKLLGIYIDYKFKFDTNVGTICKKAHRKLTAFSRITNYMELPKRRILMNAFLKLNLTIALSLGCFIDVVQITKSTDSMNDVWGLSTTANILILKNS